MSLNFPTAFWKTNESPSTVVGAPISWESALWWSHGWEYDDNIEEYNNFTLKQNTNFPFVVDAEEYFGGYSQLSSYRFVVTSGLNNTCYFGWFLDGGPDNENPAPGKNDLSQYHEAQPWTIGENGHQLDIKYETDLITAWDSGLQFHYNEMGGETFLQKTFNGFTQSGDFTGTFTLSSSSDLEITVSCLAKDANSNSIEGIKIAEELVVDPNVRISVYCNSMTLHLYNPSTETETFIGSGAAPRDNRLLSNAPLRDQKDLGDYDLWYNMDMQQVKLYSGNDLTTIINTSVSPKGEPRAQSTQWVDQDSRIHGYCTSNGIGTFHGGALNNLSAGVNYQLRIKTSSYDNEFQSGAFYGFTFSFS